MTRDEAPAVDCKRQHTGLAVSDVPEAVKFYTERLGFTRGFTWGDPVTFAGVNLDEARVFLQEGRPNPGGCTLYFVVGDADELHRFHRDRDVEVLSEPDDQEYGLRDYAIRDLHGYQLVFGHYIYHVGPPIPIERVDLHVRLEKRLAALLRDLAEHKGLSLSGCLEEILLHTNEPHGEGVASPHTAAQLRHIQELKAKHGIDYDSHASYRFVEESSDEQSHG